MKITPRKICVVTGSRAEYGLLYWLMKEIEADDGLHLRLVVTGAHLLPRFGETWRNIESDGFAIDAKVPMGPEDDSPEGAARAIGRAVEGLTDAYVRLAPDIVVVLGDRYEVLAAAAAALPLRLPIAHIHGGERTDGAFDDAIRHAVTKLSHLHFTAAEPYAQRVIQLGEAPERVFDVGALGLDAIEKGPRLERADLERDLGLDLIAPVFVVTYHPATLGAVPPDVSVAALLEALHGFPEATIVFTGVNADPGNRSIDEAIRAFATDRPERTRHFESLGGPRYLSLVAHADAVIGNSSSGIIEAPALKAPTVNIGDRQKGRLRATSVIDCGASTAEIGAAISKALDPAFRAGLESVLTPYGAGGAASRIRSKLGTVDLSDLVRKSFHDAPCPVAA